MAAEGSDNNNNIIIRFIYTGADGERIPDNATHIFVHVKIVPPYAFHAHPNVVEIVCHEDVETIKEYTFYDCRSLRLVIMPGVKILEQAAFHCCDALTDVECDKLEITRESAFSECESLRSINMPSARIVEEHVFGECIGLANAKFVADWKDLRSWPSLIASLWSALPSH